MIRQGILPCKIEVTDELITPRSGLALFAEVLRVLKVEQKVRDYFPRPGSNRGYEAWSYLELLLLMLEGGGRHIEDLREIREDRTLRTLIGLGRMPALSQDKRGSFRQRFLSGGCHELVREQRSGLYHHS